MVEAYFDESFGENDRQPLCVAGYVFEKEHCIALDEAWRAVLDRHAVRYFRMSACAHGAFPFDRMEKQERIEIATACIGLIKEHASRGFAISVVPFQYNAIIRRKRRFLGSAYSFCTRQCFSALAHWAKERKYHGDIAYFFESGHKSQREANALMEEIFNIPSERRRYHYSSHTFADKVKVRPLQAADLLAWQWFTDAKKRRNGKWMGPRKDLASLINGGQYDTMTWNPAMLLAFDSGERPERLKALGIGTVAPWFGR